MAARADEGIREQGRSLKRRGMIAGAAALVAGLMTKQANQPVVATTIDGDVVLGSTSNATTTETGVLNSGPSSPGGPAIHGFRSPGAVTVVGTTLNAGVVGQTFVTDAPGVMGSSPNGSQAKGIYGISGGGHGVHGESTSGTGVHGEITSGSGAANTIAVQGLNSSTGTGGIGMVGQCDVATGIGVVGASANGVGVKGAATTGLPIVGQVVGLTSATAGVLGIGTAGTGVQGQSTGGHGLVGTTFATDGVHIGLVSYVQPGSNAIAVRGTVASGAVGYAGIFDGDVLINGALRVFGSPKNAAVKHPDGTYRLLYCMESPESWFEDFGTSKLVNGKAAITLDPDFTALVHTGEYMVYLTPQGDSKGLYVTDKTPVGFTVREQQGGTSGVGFAYRVVAKRKDIVGERLAKEAPPPALKAVQAFTVPEPPAAKPPTKKP